MKITLTPQNLEDLVAFAEGSGESVSEEVLTEFLSLSYGLSKRLAADARIARREAERLRKKMERFEGRQQELRLNREFEHMGLDSVTLAKALLFCIQQLDRKLMRSSHVTMQKLMILLYDVYANSLARYDLRPTIQGPQAYGYTDRTTNKTVEMGPWFWRVADALRETVRNQTPVDAEALEAVKKRSEDLAGMCWAVAKSRSTYTDKELFRWIKASAPYRDAHKDNNGGKWGKEYDDYLIYVWKSEQIALRKKGVDTAPQKEQKN